jgi:hypothetical protein
MLETVGAVLIFLVADLLVAVIVVVALRSVTGTFVSVYVTDDIAWLGLALLQGLVFPGVAGGVDEEGRGPSA